MYEALLFLLRHFHQIDNLTIYEMKFIRKHIYKFPVISVVPPQSSVYNTEQSQQQRLPHTSHMLLSYSPHQVHFVCE